MTVAICTAVADSVMQLTAEELDRELRSNAASLKLTLFERLDNSPGQVINTPTLKIAAGLQARQQAFN